MKFDTRDLDLNNEKNGGAFIEEDCGKMFEGRVEIRSYVLDMVKFEMPI